MPRPNSFAYLLQKDNNNNNDTLFTPLRTVFVTWQRRRLRCSPANALFSFPEFWRWTFVRRRGAPRERRPRPPCHRQKTPRPFLCFSRTPTASGRTKSNAVVRLPWKRAPLILTLPCLWRRCAAHVIRCCHLLDAGRWQAQLMQCLCRLEVM